MPGKRASEGQVTRFWNLVEAGMSPRSAAKRIGMSETWGWRMSKGVSAADANTVSANAYDRKIESQAPAPKQRHELRPEVLAMLQPAGYNAFCEAFLARKPAAWREEAAERVVSWLLDKSERTYADVNTPPGIGKTTQFTHDLPLWLICGGGVADPSIGRAIRILLGHEVKKVSIDYVRRLRRSLELRRPFYDKDQHRSADLVLTEEFGRFKPDVAEGEESIWAMDQFLVAQTADVDLYEKEPTVQAASHQGGFLGERVNFYSWDDLATTKNSRSPEISDALDRWFEDEAETRLEPGGVGLLVGQRLGPMDLHRKRLDKTWVDDENGELVRKYHHIIFPAHHEETCDGDHRQWDLKETGCVLDESRLSWREIRRIEHEPNFRTVYQQEDSDPGAVLVLPIWLDGGQDALGFDAVGCWDHDRSWFEIPNIGRKAEDWISYAVVDPSATNWWAIEWWATVPVSSLPMREWNRYLIYGKRAKLQAGGPNGFLDWDAQRGVHVGVMEDLQVRSVQLKIPIYTWVIESNAAHRYVQQYEHFRAWRRKYPYVKIIPHQTQRNKNDPVLGIEGSMRMPYRNGLKRLPRSSSNPDTLNYMKTKKAELTMWPQSPTDDTVMADWFGEYNFETIVRYGLTRGREQDLVLDPRISFPRYLRNQRQEQLLTRDR